ncbi:MAG: phosphatase PAP2 family protein [Patescibacteria group bacterium]
MNEVQIVLAVQSLVFATPWMLTVAIICAKDLIFLNLLLAIWLLTSRKSQERHAVFEAGWAVALALIVTSLLSHFIGRVRPFLSDPHVLLLIPAPLNTSFPSGHTATAVAIACAIWFANKDLGIAAFVIAAFVAIGRIAVGVHYPTDILGGLFVGVLSFGIVRLAHHELAKRDIMRAAAQHHHDA